MKLAITPGDPLGIGPEIAAKALARWREEETKAVLYGPEEEWARVAEHIGNTHHVDMVSLPSPSGRKPATPQASAWGGAVAMEALECAVRDAMEGVVDAVVTGPVSKQSMHLAGWRYPGQTELIAKLTGAEEYAMMLANGVHCAVLATRHVPIREVSSCLSVEGLVTLVLLVDRELRRLLKRQPRILVCGLNPHAGDRGLLGSEEREIIAPAMEAARGQGICIVGPISAEEAFMTWGRDGDVVIAMYHDQAAIPIKMLGLHSAVNVTLGMPVVRTSPGHGTAFSLVGTGRADEGSFLEAMKWATRLASIPHDSHAKRVVRYSG